MINVNEWDVKIAEREGGKINLSIAQIKEVRKIILEDLAEMEPADVLSLLDRYKE